MKTLVQMKCPSCGANLEVEEDREFVFCQYCGTKILINDENKFTYRHIDDAEIKRAETEQYVRLKQLEMEEKKRIDNKNATKTKIVISLILLTVGILMITLSSLAGSASGDSNSGFGMVAMIGFFPIMGAAYIWLFSAKKEDEDDDLGDKVKVPSSITDYEKKSYMAIESMFISAGFKNIKCVPLNDLSVGILKKPGMVESITINGHKITSGGRKFSPDAMVVISYHSIPGRF